MSRSFAALIIICLSISYIPAALAVTSIFSLSDFAIPAICLDDTMSRFCSDKRHKFSLEVDVSSAGCLSVALEGHFSLSLRHCPSILFFPQLPSFKWLFIFLKTPLVRGSLPHWYLTLFAFACIQLSQQLLHPLSLTPILPNLHLNSRRCFNLFYLTNCLKTAKESVVVSLSQLPRCTLLQWTTIFLSKIY